MDWRQCLLERQGKEKSWQNNLLILFCYVFFIMAVRKYMGCSQSYNWSKIYSMINMNIGFELGLGSRCLCFAINHLCQLGEPVLLEEIQVWCSSQVFSLLWLKVLTRTIVEEERFEGSWFQRSQFMNSRLHFLGLEGRQNTMVEKYGRGKLLTWWSGSRERLYLPNTKYMPPRKAMPPIPSSSSHTLPAFSYHSITTRGII